MNRIKNEQKIKVIKMFPDAYTRCELGGDFYKNELEVIFEPDSCYPDYTEVQEWIMSNIDGKDMNIEDVVNEVYKFLTSEYKPKSLKIINRIADCRTHFDVIVEK